MTRFTHVVCSLSVISFRLQHRNPMKMLLENSVRKTVSNLVGRSNRTARRGGQAINSATGSCARVLDDIGQKTESVTSVSFPRNHAKK